LSFSAVKKIKRGEPQSVFAESRKGAAMNLQK
jgi:hypothetical protein